MIENYTNLCYFGYIKFLGTKLIEWTKLGVKMQIHDIKHDPIEYNTAVLTLINTTRDFGDFSAAKHASTTPINRCVILQ